MAGWSILRDAAGPVAASLLVPLNETYNATLMDGVGHLLADYTTTVSPSGDIEADSVLNNISLIMESTACVPGSCEYGLHNDMQVRYGGSDVPGFGLVCDLVYEQLYDCH